MTNSDLVSRRPSGLRPQWSYPITDWMLFSLNKWGIVHLDSWMLCTAQFSHCQVMNPIVCTRLQVIEAKTPLPVSHLRSEAWLTHHPGPWAIYDGGKPCRGIKRGSLRYVCNVSFLRRAAHRKLFLSVSLQPTRHVPNPRAPTCTCWTLRQWKFKWIFRYVHQFLLSICSNCCLKAKPVSSATISPMLVRTKPYLSSRRTLRPPSPLTGMPVKVPSRTFVRSVRSFVKSRARLARRASQDQRFDKDET
jgi:hypothetical protein